MRKRILANYIIILILSALITGALAFYFIENSYIDNKEEKLATNINLIESVLTEKYGDSHEEINFHKLAQKISSDTNSRITFIGVDGWVISDSKNNSIIFSHKKNTPEYKHAIKGQKHLIRRYSSEIGKKYFYLALPPIKLGSNFVILRMGDSFDSVDHIMDKFLLYFATATVIGIFFAIIISYISVGKITKPIKELTKATRLISGGDFDNRIMVDTKDEIEELSLSFNQMDKQLKYTINKIKKRNTEMYAILSSIQDGIIAIDQENKVVLANNSLNSILDISKNINEGEDISEIFSKIEGLREIEYEILNSKDYYTELKIKDKILSLSTYPIRDQYQGEIETGTLIIIKDITSIRNLEQMRKEFVANVSHELRTPLTSIGGFVETLKIRELDDDNKEKVLDIIELETERLKGLINELLNLSKIESIKQIRDTSLIDVRKDILETIELLEPQLRNDGIKMDLKMDDNLNMINGDKELFRQILINLIENSIKYNKSGGIIKVSVLNHKSGIKLIVEDDGIGIGKEDIDRIFERFYRVEKSRLNTTRGTGLGLAIVKHIVLYFGGTIEVESEIDSGTKFTVILSK